MGLKIAIVGTGAIGAYYGARLAAAGERVHFLARGELEAIRARGITVKMPDSEIRVPAVQASGRVEEIGTCDLVIVALKATANGVLETLLPPLLHPKTAILTLENGLGCDELLAARFGGDRVVGGLCFICVNRTGPGEVSCLQPGSIALGEFEKPISPRLLELQGMFTRAGIRCTVGNNLSEIRWCKLVWNVPFNGLSIAAGCVTTDRILGSPSLEAEARALMAEVIAGARAIGHGIPESFIQQQIDLTRPMGPYRPSSLIDFQAGREVEVEAIWGEPLRRAESAGARLPRLEMLYHLIQYRCDSR